MDVTLHVMISPPNHSLNGLRDAARHRAGDILDVYLASKYADWDSENSEYKLRKPPGHPRFGFIHVTGCPDVNIATVKDRLTRRIYEDSPADPARRALWRRKLWHIPPSIVPQAIKDKLLNDKEVTLTWAQVKPYVRKKIVSNSLDADSDNINTELNDSDIS